MYRNAVHHCQNTTLQISRVNRKQNANHLETFLSLITWLKIKVCGNAESHKKDRLRHPMYLLKISYKHGHNIDIRHFFF